MASFSGGSMDSTTIHTHTHTCHEWSSSATVMRRVQRRQVFTRHVAGPLVALEVELPSGLGDVLGRLLLLELTEPLLGISTQEVHS